MKCLAVFSPNKIGCFPFQNNFLQKFIQYSPIQFPEFLINLMIDLNQCIREGFAQETTTTVKDVTGNDAISFEQFVHDNKGAWL